MMDDTKTWTVGQLIEALQKLPQDAKVWTEGCDCWGNVVDAEVNDGGIGGVVIRRSCSV